MVLSERIIIVLGIILLMMGPSVIPLIKSSESNPLDTDALVDIAIDDTLTDENRDESQSTDLFFLHNAFIWGTYEHRWKDYLLSFKIWNDNTTNLTIHVIGYKTSEACNIHVEAYKVKAIRHLGIIWPHRCCIFAFGFFGVDVYGIRQ